MKKKIIMAIVIILSLATLMPNALAASNIMADIEHQQPNLTLPTSIDAYLIDENNNVILIPGYLRSAQETLCLSENSETAVTYDFVVMSDILEHSHTISGTDSTAYLTASMTLYYKTMNTPTEYLLTKVSGEWEDPIPGDRTRVSTTADINAVCTGVGTNNIFRRQVKEGTISSGESLLTGFQYAVQPAYSAMGATMTIKITQGGSSSWDLVIDFFPVDSN